MVSPPIHKWMSSLFGLSLTYMKTFFKEYMEHKTPGMTHRDFIACMNPGRFACMNPGRFCLYEPRKVLPV